MAFLCLFVLAGVSAFATAQQECPNNPCANGAECVLKPDGVTPYCYCPINYEGEMCDKLNRPLTGCATTNRNFYGQKTGFLSSPGYPGFYPARQVCPFFVGSADAKKFQLTFHDLDFEKGKDDLSIGGGDSVSTDNPGFVYDKTYTPLPDPITINGDRVWFNFYSDFNNKNNVDYRGFNISWRIDGDECIDHTCGPADMCVDGEFTYTCQLAYGGMMGGGEATNVGGVGDGVETTATPEVNPAAAVPLTGGVDVAPGVASASSDTLDCAIGPDTYPHGLDWDLNACSHCSCRNGSGKCRYDTCPPIKCKVPIKDASVCCHTCPPQRFFVNQVSYKFGSGSGAIISHKSTEVKVIVDIVHDMERSSPIMYGQQLWKVGMYTKMKAEAGGGRISVNEQVLDKRKANKQLAEGAQLKFNRVKYNLDLTDRRCEDIEEVCIAFNKGDNPDPDYEFIPEPNESILEYCNSVECPPPPPGVTCIDEQTSKEYQDGQRWSPSPCESCTCHSGITDCVTLQCPLLDCVETRPVEGECCPQCLVVEEGKCVYEGQIRESDSTWAISDCVSCHCDAGSISCEFFGCQCPATPEELKNCGGHTNGETWYESNCLKCTCAEGEIMCDPTPCSPPECAETVQGETDCCPRCKDDPPVEPLPCKQGDKTYYHGQTWKLDDCTTCACSNGYTSCAFTTCQPLECVNATVVPGECCMVCPDKPRNLGKPCERDGRLYKHGASWKVDKCIDCSCEDTRIICVVESCFSLTCPGKEINDDPESCCPYCEDTGPKFCTYNDVDYEDGQTWQPDICLTCSCSDGTVDCIKNICTQFCLQYEEVPGECCPRCVEDPSELRVCTYEGKQYAEGETFKKGACTRCRCENGTVMCSLTSCRPVECNVEKITQPGECCAVCPDLFCTDHKTGRRIENGERYQSTPCQACICQDSLLQCNVESCRPISSECQNEYTPKGECCQVCADATSDLPDNLPCIEEGGIVQNHGSQWPHDGCQVCTCSNGTTFCTLQSCDLPCADPIPPAEGQCCGSCPDDPRCVYDGRDFAHGEVWLVGACEECSCSRGETVCRRPQCSLPKCPSPVVEPGACCPTCPPGPGPTCDYKGNTYQEGEQFEKDECSSCVCSEGSIQCAHVSCPSITCTNAILREGKCCLECPAEPCTSKSGIRAHGDEWNEGDCNTCRCLEGAVTCDAQVCPELTCTTPEEVPDTCCDQCPGDATCEYKGNKYVKGQRFQPGPCEFCRCQENGGVFCVPASCPTLDCSTPVRKEGQCCAVCKEEGVCEFLGKQYPVDATFHPSACETCHCLPTIAVECNRIRCDISNCPNPILLEGACCPSCEEKFCNFEGQVHNEGTTFPGGPCTTCTCEEGRVNCVVLPCAPLDCSAESFILQPGQCCPTCAEPTPSCSYLGETYVEGARWRVNDCRDCWCQDGDIFCADISCFENVNCISEITVEGKCCPVCIEPLPLVTRDCNGDAGLRYQDGARWYTNCGYCTCSAGAVSCVTQVCQSLTCPTQFKRKGSCCPECVEDSKSCTLGGQTVQHGAVLRLGPCFDCMCYNSAFYCWGSVCRMPTCDNPILLPNSCCLECPAEPDVPEVQDCVLPDGRNYAHGTIFQTEPCVYCQCNNGSGACNHEPCEAKACDDQGEVTLKGECCSTCRSEVRKCVVKGTTYSHDDRWRIGECKECYCDNGLAKCADMMCPKANCSEPVKEEGVCCPTCPTKPVTPPCSFDGMEYADDDEWRRDKCTLCTCVEGTIKCTADPCPALDCENPIRIEGECCRLCPEDAKSCDIDGKLYKHGESLRDEQCRECICDNGAKTCYQKNCPDLSCSETSAFLVEGECCPQCPGDNKRFCTVNDLKYSDGQTWPKGNCETCRCDQGQVSCTAKSCPSVTCENPVRLAGECCLKCPEDLKSCSIEGVEVPHDTQGPVRAGDQCERCSCSNGETSCFKDKCPTPECDNPLQLMDGCCESCPDQPTCEEDGYHFAHGEGWQKDECTYCQCVDGVTLCDKKACPVLTCAEVVHVDGECCPQCKDTADPCVHDGTEYEHGTVFPGKNCTRCSCEDGAVTCFAEKCPANTCDTPTKEPEECCSKCPGDPEQCVTDKGTYNHGEKWKSSDCVTCECVDGKEQCSTEQCPVLECADPQNVEGECCRQCPDKIRSCTVGGVVYKHKEHWQPTLCENCQCNDGTVDCTSQTCPPLTCPEPIEQEDRCCPTCPGTKVLDVCNVDDVVYSDQQSWRTDACTTCTCNAGTVACAKEACPKLECTQGEPIVQEGQCCKVCPEEAQQCEVDGVTYDHGKFWHHGDCGVCTCKNGQVTCDVEKCSSPDCESPVEVEGECCLQCPDVVPTRDCEHQGNVYPHSYRWDPDVCTKCNCYDGKVSCKDVQCTEILCSVDEQVKLEGECCPVCQDQAQPCIDDAGKAHDHGDRYAKDDCTRCLCLNADITCDTFTCPPLECVAGIPVDGQCCDECPGVPAIRPKDSCIDRGREYVHGETWRVDDCKSCTCNDGLVSCSFESCPRLACEGTAITVDGKCCQVCPVDAEFCTVDDKTYEHGASWEPTVCNKCTCNDNSVSCDYEDCPVLTCEETEDVGQCCKQCKGQPPFNKCTYKGKDYKHGEVLKKTDCKKCTCEDGDWTCENELCPELTCEDWVTIPGECCMKCPEDAKPCVRKDATYKHGEKFYDGPCTACVCDNSSAICQSQNCPAVLCNDPFTPEGECCAVCPGIAPATVKACRSGGKKYKHGEPWSPSECADCFCSNGDITCNVDTCPRVTCDNPVKIDGECCKVCPDQMNSCEVDDNGSVREHLDSWRESNCKTCKCFNGKLSCDTLTCPPVDCESPVVPDAQCCSVCPGDPALTAKSCEVEGKTYQHRERWDEDSCTSCGCDNSTVTCESPACDALTCSNPIKVEGECCLRCPEDAQPCVTPDNEEYPHGKKWRDGDCRTCKCNNGKTDCVETQCPDVTCSNPITVPGQCCKQCEGRPFETCTYEGSEYQHGERFDRGLCSTCVCSDGKVDCEIPVCPLLTCSKPVKVKGQCCRICPDDFKTCLASDGTQRKHGEEWKDGDCITCTCADGTTSCNTFKCPELTCDSGIRDPGQCCPRCPTDPAPETCVLKTGIEYISGQSWPKGPCRTCTCDAGSKSCESETCPVLTCDAPVKIDGECCKRCSDDIPTCLVSGGVSYKHGESWQQDTCKKCKCIEGSIICSDHLCPKPACDNSVSVDGECCPQCPGVPPPKSCQDDLETKAHGDTWQDTPCKSCSCSNGRIDCESEICAALSCTDTVKVKGECCRRCKEDAKDCPSDTGTPYKHGESWSPDPCTTCDCYDGAKACSSKSCNPVECENPITLTSECCPRCHGDPIPVPCQYEGKEVASGDRLRINPCEYCQCNNGIVSCTTESCTPLTCPNSVKVAGECCRICLDEPDTGCMVDGRRMKTGESFQQSPCSTCTCYFGSLECELTVCPEPECNNAIKEHDECCPRCPDQPVPESCTYRSKTYESGESFSTGPCKTCSCQNGDIDCEKEQCPSTICDNPKQLADECCLKCPDEIKECTTADNTTYEHGTTFKRGDCITCVCDNGVVTCSTELCPMLECEEPISDEGTCCDRCPGDLRLKQCTTKTGEKMQPGQSWRESPCKVCTCDNGNVRCDKEKCPTLKCDNPLDREPEECCKKCPPDPSKACSAEDGTTYMPGETWSPDACLTCECTELGGVRCKKEDCPATECAEPITIEGQCCKTCDPSAIVKPLKYCTSNRKEGDAWSPQPCAQCTCTSGEISCVVETCKPLDCADLVKHPDDCCPHCARDIRKCRDADNIAHRQGEFWRPTNCEECTCDAGVVKCRPITCEMEPTCNNPLAVDDQCCPVCPGEDFKSCNITRNRQLKHGEAVKLDECTTCTCNEGRQECLEETCPALVCQKAFKRDGECCAECPPEPGVGDCNLNGVTYRNGDTFEDPADKCLHCLCSMSEIVCGQQTACPAADCASPIVLEGECCPTCIEGVCEYNNKLYVTGEEWDPTDCEHCQCTDGVVGCSILSCVTEPCGMELVTMPGRCCPECPDKYRTCMDKVGMYNHGEKWIKSEDVCVECVCDDSAICCEHIQCPEPQCENPVTVPGQCCPQCGVIPTECSYNNAIYQNGDSFDEGCRTCTCAFGQVTCARKGCAPLPCPSPIMDEGACCPRCGASCFHQNVERHDGEQWEDPTLPCFTCTCVNGPVACERQRCPPLPCRDPSLPAGACCPTCPDISFGRTGAQLQRSGSNNYALSYHVGIENTEKVIQGPDLWRIRMWSSERSDGGGPKKHIVKQALNPEQSGMSIGLADTELQFEGLEYIRDLKGQPCQTQPFICAEFFITKSGTQRYITSKASGEPISMFCLQAC